MGFNAYGRSVQRNKSSKTLPIAKGLKDNAHKAFGTTQTRRNETNTVSADVVKK